MSMLAFFRMIMYAFTAVSSNLRNVSEFWENGEKEGEGREREAEGRRVKEGKEWKEGEKRKARRGRGEKQIKACQKQLLIQHTLFPMTYSKSGVSTNGAFSLFIPCIQEET